jgi:hypothetical protein
MLNPIRVGIGLYCFGCGLAASAVWMQSGAAKTGCVLFGTFVGLGGLAYIFTRSSPKC